MEERFPAECGGIRTEVWQHRDLMCLSSRFEPSVVNPTQVRGLGFFPAIPRYMGLDFDIIIQLSGFYLAHKMLTVAESAREADFVLPYGF